MANGNKNDNKNEHNNVAGNGFQNASQEEATELSVEDYELISVGLIALGEIFSFLSLLKAKQVTKESGGQIETPELFTLSTRSSTKKSSKRKRRIRPW